VGRVLAANPYSPEQGVPVLPGFSGVQDGWTALLAAAHCGHLECLKELLAKGAAVQHACKVKDASLRSRRKMVEWFRFLPNTLQ
jgi:hypothetical protein